MNLSPTLKQNRIHELDIFRGFAILGIFMVNILVMNVSFLYRAEWEAEQIGWLQRASFFTLETIFYSKFFTIFSFLFGAGVALQIRSLKAKNTYSTSFFLRRFGALFLFGVAHILFIWSGDILHLYAMLGLLLLIFFRYSAKVLLWSSVIIFLFPFFHFLFEQLMDYISFDYSAPLEEFSRNEIFDLKHNGSYPSGIQLRIKEYAYAMGLIFSGIAPIALTMMLLGGYFVKKGGFENMTLWLQKIKPYLFISLGVLLVYRFLLLYWVIPSFEIPFGSPLSITLMTFFQLSDISLSISFLWIIAYLWNKQLMTTILSAIKNVGRMAFSNYIFQSCVGYLIMRTFNGYEYFSAFGCILLVLSCYSVQVILSKYWLQHFKYGPLEWLWRCISYKKLLPIK